MVLLYKQYKKGYDNMVFCKNCGTQVEDGQLFCPACGQAIDNMDQAFSGNNQTFDGSGAGYDPTQAQQPPMATYDPGQQYGGGPQPGYGGPQPGYGAPVGGMGGMMGIPERNIVTCIILSLVTCGIYIYYWFYCLTEDTNKISGEPNPTSGGMSILLAIVTCGIYSIYWMYKRGEYIDRYHQSRGVQSNNAVLYLVLSLVGLGIVSYAMMQNELNQIARGF